MANGEEHGSAESFKLAAAMCLFAVAVIGGILPLRLKDVGSRVISSLNTAAGGVFFASAMVHMLPESSETLDDLWGGAVPWGGMICSLGFLLILCIDQAISITSANRKGKLGGVHSLLHMQDTPDGHANHGIFESMGGPSDSYSRDFTEVEMNSISPHALLGSTTEMEQSSSLIQQPSSPSLRTSATHDDSPTLRIKDSNGSYSACSMPACQTGNASGGDGSCKWGNDSPTGRSRGREYSINNGVGGHACGGGAGGGHTGHSHGMGVAGDGVTTRLALLLALSVHSVMEGLGLGARSSKAWNLLFAIFIHKGLAAYALGTSLLQTGIVGSELMCYVVIFSAMTPTGILLGALIEQNGENGAAGAVCVALAAGTFLFVSLMEVLPPELCSTEHGWSKLGCLLGGFVLSAGAGLLVG